MKQYLAMAFSGALAMLATSAQAETLYIEKPSIACKAHLQIAFADMIQPAGNGYAFSFERGAANVEISQYDNYALHAKITGLSRSALITRPEGQIDAIFAIQDPDLPCRARASNNPPVLQAASAVIPAGVPAAPQAIQTQPVIQQPVAQPVIQQPVAQPVIQQPVVQQPVVQQPIVQQPVTQTASLGRAQPVQPVVQQPVVQPVQPVIQQPVVQQPVIQQAATGSVQANIDMALRSKLAQIATPAEAQGYLNEVQARITMFLAISQVIQTKPMTTRQRVLSVVDNEITRLRAEKDFLQQQLSAKFSTPIRPANANLGVSAFRAADTFPKIPYYVPGTNEFGEMLVVPRVSDVGTLQYDFDFIDPVANYAKVRDRIEVAHEDIDALIDGLNKVDEWTSVAQENNINRRIEKTASCIPDGQCATKKPGVASTEVIFQIYEDGSTAGRIQRNKGLFVAGYNMSVESSILLSAYLVYMKEVGAKEFQIGIMSDDQVKGLFK